MDHRVTALTGSAATALIGGHLFPTDSCSVFPDGDLSRLPCGHRRHAPSRRSKACPSHRHRSPPERDYKETKKASARPPAAARRSMPPGCTGPAHRGRRDARVAPLTGGCRIAPLRRGQGHSGDPVPGGVRDRRSPGLGLRGPCWHTSWCRPRSPCLRFMLRRSVARVNNRPRRSPNSPKAVLVTSGSHETHAPSRSGWSHRSRAVSLTPKPSAPENDLDGHSPRVSSGRSTVGSGPGGGAARPSSPGLGGHFVAFRMWPRRSGAHSVMGAGSLPVDSADGSALEAGAASTSRCAGRRGPHAAQGVGVAREAAASAPFPHNSVESSRQRSRRSPLQRAAPPG